MFFFILGRHSELSIKKLIKQYCLFLYLDIVLVFDCDEKNHEFRLKKNN